MKPLLRSVLLGAIALAGATLATADMRVLVVSGLGGDPQYDERFATWSQMIGQASSSATGDPDVVKRLAGAAATRDAVTTAITAASRELEAGDQFVLVLIGHGSYDGSEYRFNIPGPDITGSEISALLDRFGPGVAQLLVNATSTSGAVAERWARSGRVVITATRSGGERNATRFAGYWADALTSEESDRDKDGSVTAQEAYDYAVRKVADSFKSDAAILTERARISGNDPGRFVVARQGVAALFASDAQLQQLRQEENRIQLRIGELREQKAGLAETDYYDRLEMVLVEIARVGQRIDARLAVLGVNAGGDGNAQP